ncbi:HAD family hydrolase [Corynebacterium sp. Marseille-Q2516]
MTRRMMAFDMDGTILFHSQVRPATAAAIRRWQDAGNLAVCATGKSLASARGSLVNQGVHFDHFVLYTGAAITDGDFRIEHATGIPDDRATELFARFCHRPGIDVYATTLGDTDYLVSKGVAGATMPIPLTCADGSPEQVVAESVMGIPLWIPNLDELGEVAAELAQDFPDVDVHRNVDVLDIVLAGSSKSGGLRALVELLGGQWSTLSIGDSYNDVDMHRWADHSASFSYSPAEVQAATDVVVDTAEEFIADVLAR